MGKRITVTVAPDGTIHAEASGNQGTKCLADIDIINSLVPGSTVTDSRLTAEYYELAIQTAHDKVPEQQWQGTSE